MKPVLKWAGGKRQLIDVISTYINEETIGDGTYYEPFFGGGFVFFHLQPKKAVINDFNKEIVNVYKTIKNHPRQLIALLQEHTQNNTVDYFYQIRALDREEEYTRRGFFTNAQKAARTIYLNKTCFNGLYRVNSKGFFNVPFNNAKNPLICDVENLNDCNKLLHNVTIHVGDYSSCKSFIDKNTFVYIDPPYRPLTQSSSFTSYNENGFTDKEQIELGSFITDIAKKGAHIIASNSDPKNADENDNFFDDLYSAFEVERIHASRMINSNASKRGAINELLISNIAM